MGLGKIPLKLENTPSAWNLTITFKKCMALHLTWGENSRCSWNDGLSTIRQYRLQDKRLHLNFLITSKSIQAILHSPRLHLHENKTSRSFGKYQSIDDKVSHGIEYRTLFCAICVLDLKSYFILFSREISHHFWVLILLFFFLSL